MAIPSVRRSALSGQPTTYKLRLKDDAGAFQDLTGRTFSLVLMKRAATLYAYAASVAVETIGGVSASTATMTVPGADNTALLQGAAEDYAGKIGETVDGAFGVNVNVLHQITAGPDPDALPGGDGGAEGEAVVYTLLADTGLIEITQQGARGPRGYGVHVQADTPEVPAGEAYLWVQTGLGDGGADFTIWIEDGQ